MKMRNIPFLALFLVILNDYSSCNGDGLPNDFYTYDLPDDRRFMPTLGNGHVGLTIFSDTIHMNGLYNGKKGLSHRARIPNYSNLSLTPQSEWGPFNTYYSLNVEEGTFQIHYSNEKALIKQVIYVHRFFSRAIVNQILVYRRNATGAFRINIRQEPGHRSDDIDFSEPTEIPTTETLISAEEQQQETYENAHKHGAISIHNKDAFRMIQGYTKELEDDVYQKSRKHVCCLWNHVPEEITLPEDQQFASLQFVMTVDELCSVAKQEMMDISQQSPSETHRLHRDQWTDFWDSFQISADDNLKLAQSIYGSIFYLVSSLPSFKTNQPNNDFYGLSPTGLGRGSSLHDYEGHSFWDTEIWMFPSVAQMDPRWAKLLLNYRFRLLTTAKSNARELGYHGAKYPWESAFTGVEVTQPCCPEVSYYELHITADIAFAIRNYFGITQDIAWMQDKGCELISDIAEFWASRVVYDGDAGKYDIKHVMGPDEDHSDVSNNAFTNFVVKTALTFANALADICSNRKLHESYANWQDIASKIEIPYDSEHDYHPQYDGYKIGTKIKQADTILLGYPLLMPMNLTTRKNDLEFYETVTRESGPAMTWAMHSINNLDVEEYTKADRDFGRAYENNIRSPFNVWSEVLPGRTGAVNFLTGAGGFLQALINGYAGVRIYYDCMEINKPRLLPNTTQFSVSGIQYLGTKFRISVNESTAHLTVISINPEKPVTLHTKNGSHQINENFVYELKENRIFLIPVNKILRQNECPMFNKFTEEAVTL